MQFRCWHHVESQVESQRDLRGVRHFLAVPRRIPDELQLDVRNSRDFADFRFHLPGQDPGNRTTWRGKRHGDPRVPFVIDLQIVNQPQLVNVDGDLGVENRLERVDGFGFERVHSVDTLCSAFWSAACNVCQASVAHLTRAGNSRTPEKTASLPMSGTGVSVVSSWWKRSKICCTCSRVLPFSVSVISDAEATEMAQPAPV